MGRLIRTADKLGNVLIMAGLLVCWAISAAVFAGMVNGLPDGFAYFLAAFAILATLGVSLMSGPWHRCGVVVAIAGFALFVPVGLIGIFGVLRTIYPPRYEEFNSHSH
jgi:hypothetical protein